MRGGNARWLGVETHFMVQNASAEGHSVFGLTLGDELVAAIALEDSLRKKALEVVAKLKQHKTKVSLVSGDGFEAVHRVARTLGIPFENVRWRATPADKQHYLCSLLAKPTPSRRTPHVLFCSDGTNDSVALAQATIGVCMSGGTDIAKGAADVVLASPHL